ncbi:glycosyltransferase family 2 protein [Catenovulum sediminis]|uniref:glycosyltransferase family 2 protein n=1 Tax=Catenovulum sediminis TaxID=1740262 RepID=UPI00163DBC77|nr:glycosyltransferase [Catenovulum sediminis]
MSILMPVKNVEPYISECMDSILKQTYSKFEIIVVDDHSTDMTADIVKQYANNDARVKLVKAQESGFVAALNLGLEYCSCNLIARMDGDDIAREDRFQIQMDFMENNPDVDVCGSWIELFGQKTEVWHYRQFDSHIKSLMMFKRSGFGHNAVIVRKKVYDAFKYESAFEFCEDYRLWCQLATKSTFKFHNIQMPLVKYRIHSTQVIATKTAVQSTLREKILKDFIAELGWEMDPNEFILYQAIRELDFSRTKASLQEIRKMFERLREISNARFGDDCGLFDLHWQRLVECIDAKQFTQIVDN